MAGISTTPELATMPTEIVCMIGAELSVHDLKEWTLASKRFRDIFITQICKHIKFSGNMEQLDNNILSYFQTATASFRDLVHHNIRCVTFDVQAFDTPRTLRAWVRHPPASLQQIGRFIISNPNLHRVAFNTHLKKFKEIRLFRDLVEAGPPWPNVKSLSFQLPRDNALVISALVRKLEEGALQTLSTCAEVFLVTPIREYSYVANVTSLSICRQDRQDWWWLSRNIDPVIAGLDEGLLKMIHISFPKLESLVLYDGFRDDSVGSGSLANGAMVASVDKQPKDSQILSSITDIVLFKVRIISKAVSTLKKMQSLRRFSFEFDKSRLNPDAVSEILEQTPNSFNDVIDDDWEDEAVADFLLLSLLVHHLPTIEEICITSDYPGFYRATLTEGEWDCDFDSFDDPSQRDLFPSVLMR